MKAQNSFQAINSYIYIYIYIYICVCVLSGFDFPGGPGAYAPRFCCGPLDFSDMGPEIVQIIILKSYFKYF